MESQHGWLENIEGFTGRAEPSHRKPIRSRSFVIFQLVALSSLIPFSCFVVRLVLSAYVNR